MTNEYCRVPWEQVAELAGQGWRLMEIPPMPEMKNLLGQVQMTGVVLFFMERDARGSGNGTPDPAARSLLAPRLVRAVARPRREPGRAVRGPRWLHGRRYGVRRRQFSQARSDEAGNVPRACPEGFARGHAG